MSTLQAHLQCKDAKVPLETIRTFTADGADEAEPPTSSSDPPNLVSPDASSVGVPSTIQTNMSPKWFGRQNSSFSKSNTALSEVDSHYHDDQSVLTQPPLDILKHVNTSSNTLEEEDLTLGSSRHETSFNKSGLLSEIDSQYHSKKSLALSEVDSLDVSKISSSDETSPKAAAVASFAQTSSKNPFFVFLPRTSNNLKLGAANLQPSLFTTSAAARAAILIPEEERDAAEEDPGITPRATNIATDTLDHDYVIHHHPPIDHHVALGELAVDHLTSDAPLGELSDHHLVNHPNIMLGSGGLAPSPIRSTRSFDDDHGYESNTSTLSDNDDHHHRHHPYHVQAGGASTSEGAMTQREVGTETPKMVWKLRCVQAQDQVDALTQRLTQQEHHSRQLADELREKNCQEHQIQQQFLQLESSNHTLQQRNGVLRQQNTGLVNMEDFNQEDGANKENMPFSRDDVPPLLKDRNRLQSQFRKFQQGPEVWKATQAKQIQSLQNSLLKTQNELENSKMQHRATVATLTTQNKSLQQDLTLTQKNCQTLKQEKRIELEQTSEEQSQRTVQDHQQRLQRELQTCTCQKSDLESRLAASQTQVKQLTDVQTKLAQEKQLLECQNVQAMDTWTAKMKQLQDQLGGSVQEKQGLGDTESKLQGENARMETQLAQAQASQKAIEMELLQSKAETKQARQDLLEQTKSLQNQLEASALESQKLHETVVRLEEPTESLIRQKTAFLEKTETLEAEKQMELANITKTLNTVQDALEHSQSANVLLEDQVVQLQAEKEATEQTFQESLILQSKLLSLEEQVASLEQAKATLESIHMAVQEKHSIELSKASARTQAVEQQLDCSKHENAFMDERVAALEAQKIELEKQLSCSRELKDATEKALEEKLQLSESQGANAQKKLAETESALKAADNDLLNSQGENARILEEKDLLETRLKDAYTKAESLQTEIQSLELQVHSFTLGHACLVAEKEVLLTKKKELEANLSTNKSNYESKLKKTFSEKVESDDLVASLLAKLIEMELELYETQASAAEVEKKLAKSREELVKVKIDEGESRRLRSELELELDQSKMNGAKLGNDFAALHTEANTIKAEKTELEEQSRVIAAKKAEELDQVTSLLAKTQNEFENTQNEKRMTETKLALSEMEKEELQQKLSLLEKRADDFEHKLLKSEEAVSSSNRENLKLIQRQEVLKTHEQEFSIRAGEMEEVVTSLTEQIEQMKKQEEKLVHENLTLNKQTAKLLEVNAEALEKVDCQLQELNAEKRIFDDRIAELRSKKECMEVQLFESKDLIKEVESKLARAKSSLTEAVAQKTSSLERQKMLDDQLVASSSKANELEITLASLHSMIKRLEKEQKDLLAEKTNLQAEKNDSLTYASRSIEDAESKLEQVIAEKKILDGMVSELKSKKDVMEMQLADALNLIKDVESKLATSESSLNASKTEKNASLRRQRELEDRLMATSSKMNELMKTVVSLNTETERLKKEQEVLQAENESLQSEKIEALSSVSSKAQNTERRLHQIVGEKHISDAKVFQLESEHIVVTKRLAEAIKSLKDEKVKLVSTEAFLIEAETEKKSFLECQRELEVQLVTSSSKSNELELAFASLSSAVEIKNKKQESLLAAKTEALSRAHRSIEDKERQLRVTFAEKETLDAKVSKLESEKGDIEKQFAEAQEELAASSSKTDELESTCANLQSEILTLKTEQEDLLAEKENLQEEKTEALSRAYRSIEDKERQLRVTFAEKETLDLKVSKLESEKGDIEKQFAEAQEELAASSSKTDELESTCANLQSEILTLKTEQEDLLAEKENLQGEKTEALSRAHRRFEAKERQLRVTFAEKETLDAKVSKLESEKGDIEKQFAEAQEELAASSSKTDELESTCANLQSEILTLKTEQEDLLAEKENLQGEKTEALSRAHRRFEAKERQLRVTFAEKETLDLKVSKLESEKGDIEKQFAEAQEELAASSSKTDELESTCANLQSEILTLKTEQEDLLAEKENLQGEKTEALSRAHRRFEAKERQLRVTFAEKETLDAKVSKLESEKGDIEKQFAEAQEELAASSSKTDELESTCANLQSEILTLKTEQEDLLAEKENLQGEKTEALSRAHRSFEAKERQLRVTFAEKETLDAKVSKLESEKGDIKKLEETICKFQDQLDAERKQAALMHEKVMALEADKDKFEEILVEAQALIRDKETPESSKMIDLFVAYNVENMTDLERQSQDVKSLNIVIANARKDAHAKTETQIRSLKKKLTVCQNEKDALLKATKLLASKVQELHHSTTVVEPVGVEVRENAYQRVLSPHTLEKMEHTFSQERRPACEFGRSIERVYQRDLLLELHYHDKDEKEQFYNVSAKYTGPLLEGVPHGPGILRFVCGDMYLGEFEMGEMMGFGAFNHVRRDDHINQVFKGEFSHNEFRGANKKKAPLIERVLVSRTPSKLIALGDANCSTSRSNNGVAIFLFQENDNQQQL